MTINLIFWAKNNLRPFFLHIFALKGVTTYHNVYDF